MAEADLETGEVGEWKVAWEGTGGLVSILSSRKTRPTPFSKVCISPLLSSLRLLKDRIYTRRMDTTIFLLPKVSRT